MDALGDDSVGTEALEPTPDGGLLLGADFAVHYLAPAHPALRAVAVTSAHRAGPRHIRVGLRVSAPGAVRVRVMRAGRTVARADVAATSPSVAVMLPARLPSALYRVSAQLRPDADGAAGGGEALALLGASLPAAVVRDLAETQAMMLLAYEDLDLNLRPCRRMSARRVDCPATVGPDCAGVLSMVWGRDNHLDWTVYGARRGSCRIRADRGIPDVRRRRPTWIPALIDVEGLDALVRALRARAYTVIGPRERSGAIVYDELTSRRRPARRPDRGERRRALPARGLRGRIAVPPRRRPRVAQALPLPAARAHVADRRQELRRAPRRRRSTPSSACARATCTRSRSRTACSSSGRHVEPDYAARRRDAFFVAVNCTRAGATCFCVSMDTGPRATSGLRPRADRAARRPALRRRGGQRARRGGARGAAERAGRRARRARRGGRGAGHAPRRWGAQMETDGLRELLQANAEHPRWDDGRRALRELRQLHAGLPDVLLLERRGRDRPGGRRERAHAGVGLAASRSSTPTCTAAACARRRARATGSG